MTRPTLSQAQRRLLLSPHTSHANKMAFVAEYVSRGYFINTDWEGNVRKRAAFQFEPEGSWHTAQDYLNDIMSSWDDVE